MTKIHLLRSQALLDEGASKSARVFRILREAGGAWVPLPELGQAVQSRCLATLIAELRKQGCEIENKLCRAPFTGPGENREFHSWYRLLKEPKDLAGEMD